MLSMLTATILVIEPSAAVADVVAEILHDEGYTVTTVVDGAHALMVLQEERPALILLDTKVRGPSGTTIVADLCSAEWVDIPIVLLATDAREAEVLIGVRVHEYLVKPFDIDVLLAGVSRWCAVREEVATTSA